MDALSLEREGGVWRLSLKGDWSLAAMAEIDRDLKELTSAAGAPPGDLSCDWSGAAAPGIGPTWALLSRLAALGVPAARIRHEGNPPHALALLGTLIAERGGAAPAAPAPTHESVLGRLGRWAVGEGLEARGVLGFVGRIAAVLGQSIRRPRTLRMPSIVRHIYETGVTAIPIVSLVAFLISVVVAYLGAQQLSRFGANIFVVDLVGLAVLREMGVLLTAVIVAGRSGSAFAAEIGVMQINEEIDALRAMGMNPFEVLVLPRIIALVIALPAAHHRRRRGRVSPAAACCRCWSCTFSRRSSSPGCVRRSPTRRSGRVSSRRRCSRWSSA